MEPSLERLVRRSRLAYRAHLADRVDALLSITDEEPFRAAWASVSPVLRWDHRPTARRLWRLARLGWPGTIVEIGSYAGNSTVYLAMAAGEVHAVDPHTPESMVQLSEASGSDELDRAGGEGDPSDVFLRNLERFEVQDRVVYHRATSVEAARSWNGAPVRLLYVDGMHTYEAVRDDYIAWKPFLAERHVVLFDDYLWEGVQHAVDDLRGEGACRFFYVRGGQAIFSTTRLPITAIGLP